MHLMLRHANAAVAEGWSGLEIRAGLRDPMELIRLV